MGRSPNFTFANNTIEDDIVLSQQLLDDSIRPLEVTARPILNAIGQDVNHPDTILLNILENMDDGKSPTWFYYASQLAKQYDIDYIAKCDTDSIFSLHDFLHFAYFNMPPAPYNSMMLFCIPWNKDHWQLHAYPEAK